MECVVLLSVANLSMGHFHATLSLLCPILFSSLISVHRSAQLLLAPSFLPDPQLMILHLYVPFHFDLSLVFFSVVPNSFPHGVAL